MKNTFITYQQALSIIEKHKGDFSTATQNLEDCVGTFLAEDLVADRDFPPFDRITMDGIAIVYDTFKKGRRVYKIESIAAAGTPRKILRRTENCIEVMTGAVMPDGADTVIRYEDVKLQENKATIQVGALKYKQNIHFKGSDISQGAVIVPKGRQISSVEVNIAASIGKVTLLVRKMPKVVVFSTGDELVPVDQSPKLHQIRRSNSYGIQATLKEWGLKADLQHLADNKAEMEETISGLLPIYDLLIFTGGVSKGKFDYLPEVLESLKIKKHFHKVQQRPGKPFWFGSSINGHTVFALPGNPVSSFVCTYVYIRHWLTESLGLRKKALFAILGKDISFKPDLVYFLEASLENSPDGKFIANPIKGNGSGDFANLVKTDGFLILPQGETEFKKGKVYEFVRYRESV